MSVAALEIDLALALGDEQPPPLCTLALAADPLRLDLPALPSALPSAELCRTIAALWFEVSLDSAGIVRCAEWLTDNRATLPLAAPDGAVLDAYAAHRGSWLPAQARDVMAARVFAIGPLAQSAPGDAQRFLAALAALASALVTCGARPHGPAIGAHAAVARTAGDLAAVVGAIAGEAVGRTSLALGDQLRQSVALLSRPGIWALAGAQGFWDLVRRLQGDHGPDLRRLLDQGRHGQAMLRWLGGALPALSRTPQLGPDIPADAVAAAAAWLAAFGLTPGEGSR
jgi:hypothetical protein